MSNSHRFFPIISRNSSAEDLRAKIAISTNISIKAYQDRRFYRCMNEYIFQLELMKNLYDQNPLLRHDFTREIMQHYFNLMNFCLTFPLLDFGKVLDYFSECITLLNSLPTTVSIHYLRQIEGISKHLLDDGFNVKYQLEHGKLQTACNASLLAFFYRYPDLYEVLNAKELAQMDRYLNLA